VVMTLACVSGWWKVDRPTPGDTRSVRSARQRGLSRAGGEADPVAVLDAAHLGVVGWISQHAS
jgi:hypothetical protein